MNDATIFLVEPGEPEASISQGFANPLDLFNYLSPSAWINSAIADLTGTDVFGWMTDWIGGDWAAMWKFGDALGHLAECLQQIGINIQAGVIALDASWDGNANDAAYRYFSHLASSVSGQQYALTDLRDRYHKAATGAWQMSNQLGNILQALADKAILAGIAAAAGTITAETGIGALAGYGTAALIVTDMLKLINQASIIINTAGTAILSFFGIAIDLIYQGGGGLGSIPLPAVSYTPPAA
ncbi:hypothetical protein [Plantactinospora sp. KBS50]|uniref:hypothetical protein n=1 Tax=Plantactinospora sp. KBS50 TaxID=2024580 RepID=UPI000BAACCC9|nr:hypothetical protein [Plantactinospora sp. KBS50]ASW56804.1 hypothetical protein CIK06_25570 [Plantactinospora sp. KBS50]